GLGIGAVYALSGVGLLVLFRATGVLNFAFGAIGALGAHVAWQLLEWDYPLPLAILAAVLTSTLFSFLYGRFLAPLLSYRDTVVRAVGTLALALFLIALMGVVWGELPRRLQFPTDQMYLTLFGVRLTFTRIIALVLSIVVVSGITLLLNTTRLGLDMRALANDRDLSAILGVRITRTKLALFSLGAVAMTLAGAIQAPRWTYIEPSIVFNPTVSFLTVIMALLGGPNRLFGPLLGAIPLFLLFEWLSANFPNHYSIILGLLFIAIVFLLPNGVLAFGESLLNRLRGLTREVAR
ncbi:MAG: branched-chain amino acid ABC transporter permease, partial [Rhizobiales bacterium]|nr:branched-chain amino acid ABC transporter permease [Hyphomicrobiales bacterium]